MAHYLLGFPEINDYLAVFADSFLERGYFLLKMEALLIGFHALTIAVNKINLGLIELNHQILYLLSYFFVSLYLSVLLVDPGLHLASSGGLRPLALLVRLGWRGIEILRQ